jgi:hypothetical protein
MVVFATTNLREIPSSGEIELVRRMLDSIA